MKRKRHPDRFHPDKYRDGPKKPAKFKVPRSDFDDEDLDEAFDEWKDMQSWRSNSDSDDDDWDEEE